MAMIKWISCIPFSRLTQVSALEEGILLQLLPRDEADDRDVIVEVRAGTGGDEASLFAGDLFRMYHRFAALQGWRFEPVEVCLAVLRI